MPYPEQAEDTPAPPKLDRWNGRALKPIRLWVKLAIFMGICLLVGLVLFGARNLVKSSDAFKFSMAELRSNDQVIAVLGEPIDVGWMITGNFSLKGSGGFANMSIPVSGPTGSGTITSHSVKVSGNWVIILLVLQVDGNPAPIVLINTKNLRIPNAGRAA